MNAEVALVLQRKYEQLQQLADDPSAQISQCVINCSDHKHQQVLDANIQKYLILWFQYYPFCQEWPEQTQILQWI
jgi:hypothetical protein